MKPIGTGGGVELLIYEVLTELDREMHASRSSTRSFGRAPCRALVELHAELQQSSMQSFGRAPCRASVELHAELR